MSSKTPVEILFHHLFFLFRERSTLPVNSDFPSVICSCICLFLLPLRLAPSLFLINVVGSLTRRRIYSITPFLLKGFLPQNSVSALPWVSGTLIYPTTSVSAYLQSLSVRVPVRVPRGPVFGLLLGSVLILLFGSHLLLRSGGWTRPTVLIAPDSWRPPRLPPRPSFEPLSLYLRSGCWYPFHRSS